MSGSKLINVNIEIDKFNELIAEMQRKSANTSPVMAAIGNLVVKSVRQNFREGGRPEKWTPSKKSKGKTLIGTGALMKNIHYELDGNGAAVTVMTGPQKYAKLHQFGGSISACVISARNRQALKFTIGGLTLFRKSVKHPGAQIPARPYMLLQDEDVKNIEKMMSAFIEEKD